jgi:hypothetical protein
VIRRRVREERRGADFEADVIRKFHDRWLGDDDLLGIRAIDHRRGHAIADLHGRHAIADRTDDTGGLASRRERRRRLELILAARLQDVGEVHAGGAHVDANLPGRDGRRRKLVDAQRTRPRELVNAYCSHAVRSLASELREAERRISAQGQTLN